MAATMSMDEMAAEIAQLKAANEALAKGQKVPKPKGIHFKVSQKGAEGRQESCS